MTNNNVLLQQFGKAFYCARVTGAIVVVHYFNGSTQQCATRIYICRPHLQPAQLLGALVTIVPGE